VVGAGYGWGIFHHWQENEEAAERLLYKVSLYNTPHGDILQQISLNTKLEETCAWKISNLGFSTVSLAGPSWVNLACFFQAGKHMHYFERTSCLNVSWKKSVKKFAFGGARPASRKQFSTP
jgi:hypothetical protein